MNPPYHIGGGIWDKARVKGRVIVCLMPLIKYKDEKRFLYVKDLEVIRNSFKDAIITENNSITTTDNKIYRESWELLELEAFEKNYKLYYAFNLFSEVKYKLRKSKNKRILYDNKYIFIFSDRVTAHGVHKKYGDSIDWKRNVEKISIEDIPNSYAFYYLEFSKKEYENFCKWWYFGEKLANNVILGLNKNHGTPKYAIPQIDWDKISDHPLWKEGKYDEAVLDTMGLRWENNFRTKIVKKD